MVNKKIFFLFLMVWGLKPMENHLSYSPRKFKQRIKLSSYCFYPFLLPALARLGEGYKGTFFGTVDRYDQDDAGNRIVILENIARKIKGGKKNRSLVANKLWFGAEEFDQARGKLLGKKFGKTDHFKKGQHLRFDATVVAFSTNNGRCYGLSDVQNATTVDPQSGYKIR